jgi:N-acetylneuraminic acid mutarotase
MATIKGCYQWNETLTAVTTEIAATVNFRIYAGVGLEEVGSSLRIYEENGVTYLNCVTDYSPSGFSICTSENGFDMFYSNRLIDFGETDQEVPDEFAIYLLANAVEADWDTVITSMYKLVSGAWRWNDTLPYVEEAGFCFMKPVLVNGTEYGAAMVGGLLGEGIATAILANLSGAEEELFFAYLDYEAFGANGWIEPIVFAEILGGTVEPVPSESSQIWDFGEGAYIEPMFEEYLKNNAVEAIPRKNLDITYKGETIASAECGQKVTICCNGKSMQSDLVITAPKLVETTVIPTKETQERTFNDYFAGFSKLTVSPIPDEYIIPKDTTTITTNGYHNVTEWSQAYVNVPIPEGYVKPSGTVYISSNGEHNVSGKASAVVNVPIPSGYIKPAGEVDITKPGQYTINVTDKVAVNVDIPEPNIAFGDVAPEDTSKLWIKTAEPATTSIKVFGDWFSDGTIEETGTLLEYYMEDMAIGAVNNKIYLFGGFHQSASGTKYNRMNTIFEYDISTNTSTRLSKTLAVRTDSAVAATVGNKIYIFGGYTVEYDYLDRGTTVYLNTISVFDPSDYSLTTLSTKLPTGMGTRVAAVGEKIYIFGGADGEKRFDTIYMFDTTDNSLVTLDTKLPMAASGVVPAVIDKKIYLFGGYTKINDEDIYLNTIQVFDTTDNSLVTLDVTLSEAKASPSVASLGDYICILGGIASGYNNYRPTIEVFNTKNNTIRTLSTTLPYRGIVSMPVVTIDNKIYMFGGAIQGGRINDINTFDMTPYVVLPENNVLIETNNTMDNLFDFLPTVEIGVKNVYLGNTDGHGERVIAALYKNEAWVDVHNGITLITFSIDGATYYAEQGMQWWQWLESNYNNDSRYILMESIPWDAQMSKYICNPDGTYTGGPGEITNGTAYVLGE